MAKIGALQVDTINFVDGAVTGAEGAIQPASPTVTIWEESIIADNPNDLPVRLYFEGNGSAFTTNPTGSRSGELTVTRTRGGKQLFIRSVTHFGDGSSAFAFAGAALDITAQANDEYTARLAASAVGGAGGNAGSAVSDGEFFVVWVNK